MCIQTGKTLSDEHRMRMDTDQMYVKSEEEMRALFPNFDDAIERTEEIARRCNVEFDFSTTHLPAFPLPEGKTDKGYLRELCEDGLMRKYGPDRPDARERMEYELGVIESMGYVDYFLIVWDFIHYAKTHGVGVGPGRGSGAGSIVAYALDITEIDPLKYALVFERFLNPERVSMPDIDCDFDYERRGQVIDYVRRRYGADHVAQIITFGTMAARAVIRDVGRVMDMSYQQVDAIAKMVPFELNMTLDKALKMNAELRNAYENDESIHRLIEMARKLEGMPRNASTHAAGVLITAKPVVDYCPLQTNDDVITTQFPMGTVEALGLLKMDFLGLRTLNVIMDTIEMARDRLGADFTSEDIPLDEPGVYQMISDGDTTGIFQLESSGMTQFLTQMKPSNFEDIIAAISLYRPGPMESIPRYVAGKQNPESVQYLTPQLKPILDVTYGCMVYQEQVMQIVRDLAGYSMGRSDLVRRAMAKKKHDVMAREKEVFIHGQLDDDGNVVVPGCVRNGISEDAATRLFDEMTAFASYAFNKSHAAAYALVAVQTAWLKLKFPAEFMAAMMNSMLGHTEKIAFYIQYCRKQGIPVLPPDVNRSRARFTVDDLGGKKGIRFGLGAVKNLGLKAVEALVAEREAAGPYRDLYDFVGRVTGGELNKKGVESLIRCGALDELPGSRAQKLHVFEKAMDGVARRQKSMVVGPDLAVRHGGEPGGGPAAAHARHAALRQEPAAADGEGDHRRVHLRPPAGRLRRPAFEAAGERPVPGVAGGGEPGPRHELGPEAGAHGRHHRRKEAEGRPQRQHDGLRAAGGHVRRHRGAGVPEGVRAGVRAAGAGRAGGDGGQAVRAGGREPQAAAGPGRAAGPAGRFDAPAAAGDYGAARPPDYGAPPPVDYGARRRTAAMGAGPPGATGSCT